MDVPQQQNRAITLPADPVPIFYPSVEDFTQDETNYRSTTAPTVYDPITGIPIPGTTLRITEDCENRATTPFGIPVGFAQDAVMPYNGALQKHFGVPLSLLSVTANGTCTITVTCSTVHGLCTDAQVSIEGLANVAANGFYSVTVTTATAFSYQTYGPIVSGALLTPTTLIITALVGLPYGYKRIPKIYGPTPHVTPDVTQCFLETQDGSGMFLLENGSGFLELQSCGAATDDLFELETGDGSIWLENGVDFLELEDGP